ncbi:hypothetical protein HELRODRAFT_177935 [Helobdella robusta]|uniref:Uncharacterized protein n=1 Tax=Helobdella robusta TaxID=6412 RepID=T1FCH5_HELRO|nr:hypothetical protein HELRODRAFT_177935 [Helobdella robusta]ESN97506.1 hypothetical protein HELRODRAFT_177935 [Helobdella robusta]
MNNNTNYNNNSNNNTNYNNNSNNNTNYNNNSNNNTNYNNNSNNNTNYNNNSNNNIINNNKDINHTINLILTEIISRIKTINQITQKETVGPTGLMVPLYIVERYLDLYNPTESDDGKVLTCKASVVGLNSVYDQVLLDVSFAPWSECYTPLHDVNITNDDKNFHLRQNFPPYQNRLLPHLHQQQQRKNYHNNTNNTNTPTQPQQQPQHNRLNSGSNKLCAGSVLGGLWTVTTVSSGPNGIRHILKVELFSSFLNSSIFGSYCLMADNIIDVLHNNLTLTPC